MSTATTEALPVTVEIGQVWKDLDPRSNNRTITIAAFLEDGERCECVVKEGGDNDGKTIRLKCATLVDGDDWRLLRNADGSVPESGLDEAFAAINDREGDRLNQLLLFGTPEFIVDSVGLSKHGQRVTLAGAARTRDVLLKVHSAVPYYLGDHANIVERELGEEASQVIDHEAYDKHGISESTLKTYRWVADRVPDENRRVAQSFSHAQAVAALRPDQQRKFLEESRAEDWSVSKLKVQVASRTEEGRSKLVHLLIVDCGTEAKMEKLADQLEGDGYKIVKKDSKTKRTTKPKKEKKAKGDVTAKKRGKGKMSANRRRPG